MRYSIGDEVKILDVDAVDKGMSPHIWEAVIGREGVVTSIRHSKIYVRLHERTDNHSRWWVESKRVEYAKRTCFLGKDND